jgi:hypothetical protein
VTVSSIIKECSCGRSYLSGSWRALRLIGYIDNGRDAAGEVLELRNCTCGSTIALDFGDLPPSTPRPGRGPPTREGRS